MLGTMDFTVSEHQVPFNFPYSTALFKCPLSQNEEPFQNKNLYIINKVVKPLQYLMIVNSQKQGCCLRNILGQPSGFLK